LVNKEGILLASVDAKKYLLIFPLLLILIMLPYIILDAYPTIFWFSKIILLLFMAAVTFIWMTKARTHISAVETLIILLHFFYFLLGFVNYIAFAGWVGAFDFFFNAYIFVAAVFFYYIIPGQALLTKKYSMLLVALTNFHSANIILQYLTGQDLFGNQPIGERYWGMFGYGAPTGGIFLSMLYFIPFLLLRGAPRVISILMCSFAIIMTGDRGPIVQMFLSLLAAISIYSLYAKQYLHILYAFMFILLGAYYAISNDLIPERVFVFYDFLVYNGFSWGEISANSSLLSVEGYVHKWTLIFLNWFSTTNLFNMIVGSGLGATDVMLSEIAGVGRPHNILIEVVITYGILGGLMMLLIFLYLIRMAPLNSIILFPSIIPFAFQSIYSSNLFVLFLIQIYIYKSLQSMTVTSRHEKNP